VSIEQTVEEFAESLTGFEEIAITKQFGGELDSLPGSMAGRAMVFTDLVRSGAAVDDAYRQSMEMGLKAVNKYFAEDDEITPNAPTTDSGKDDSAAVEPQKTLLPSAS